MRKIELKNLNEYIYHERLTNGLNVYLYSTKNANDYSISFFTKYGSAYNSFKKTEEKDFKEYPNGIAHFLEHKLFESETESAMDYFSKSGTDSNAYTSYLITNYYIQGKEEFANNLNYLINFVQSPYFTYENVEKEKGIIEQELNMYMDKPDFVIQETNRYNLVINHPIRYDILGHLNDINSITKEMLDDCYSTFYSPNNMYLVITGNIDVDETIKLVKVSQDKKNIVNINYCLKEYKEPKEVFKEHEILNLNVEVPMISFGIKIPLNNLDKFKFESYVNTIIYENFSKTSDFYLEHLKSGKVLRPFDISFVLLDEFILVFIEGESYSPEELVKDIKNKLKSLSISKLFFERDKKKSLSHVVYSTESHENIGDSIVNFIIDYGYPGEDIYEKINSLNYEELEGVFKGLQLDSTSSVIAINDIQK